MINPWAQGSAEVVTFEVLGGVTVTQYLAEAYPSPDDAPADVVFSHGFLRLTLTSAITTDLRVKIFLPPVVRLGPSAPRQACHTADKAIA